MTLFLTLMLILACGTLIGVGFAYRGAEQEIGFLRQRIYDLHEQHQRDVAFRTAVLTASPVDGRVYLQEALTAAYHDGKRDGPDASSAPSPIVLRWADRLIGVLYRLTNEVAALREAFALTRAEQEMAQEEQAEQPAPEKSPPRIVVIPSKAPPLA